MYCVFESDEQFEEVIDTKQVLIRRLKFRVKQLELQANDQKAALDNGQNGPNSKIQLARVLEAKDEGELLIRRLERELDVIRKSSLSAKKISGPNDVKKLHKSNADRSNHVRLLKSSSEKYLSNSNTESESFNKQPEMGEVRGRHIEAGEAGFLDESIFQKANINKGSKDGGSDAIYSRGGRDGRNWRKESSTADITSVTPLSENEDNKITSSSAVSNEENGEDDNEVQVDNNKHNSERTFSSQRQTLSLLSAKSGAENDTGPLGREESSRDLGSNTENNIAAPAASTVAASASSVIGVSSPEPSPAKVPLTSCLKKRTSSQGEKEKQSQRRYTVDTTQQHPALSARLSPVGSTASPEKDGFWGTSGSQGTASLSASNSSRHSVVDLLDELERLRKNNSEMQQVIDQLTEEIQLRDRTINDLEGQIRQLSQLISSKQESASILSETSQQHHNSSAHSSTIALQPATLYQCTRCDQHFKSIVQFQAHITECLEQSLFDESGLRIRRSRSAASSRDKSRSSLVFPPKSVESMEMSQNSINTVTSSVVGASKSFAAEDHEPEPAEGTNGRSCSTSALFHERKAGEKDEADNHERFNGTAGLPDGHKVKVVSTENVPRSVKSSSSVSAADMRKLPSQPILNYSGSKNFGDDGWFIGEELKNNFGLDYPSEPLTFIQAEANLVQRAESSFYSKNPKVKPLHKSSSDVTYIPKELRPLRPKNTSNPTMPPQNGATLRSRTASSISNAPSYTGVASPAMPPKGATLAAYQFTSPNPSPDTSLQRLSDRENSRMNSNQSLGRPSQPPPLPPKRGEESRSRVKELEETHRSRRSRVKDAVVSPFTSFRQKMRSMSSLERLSKKDSKRDKDKSKNRQQQQQQQPNSRGGSQWDVNNRPVSEQPQPKCNSPQTYSNGPSMFSSHSYYGSTMTPTPGSMNALSQRPLSVHGPQPARYYNHSYKYSSNELAARAYLRGNPGTDV